MARLETHAAIADVDLTPHNDAECGEYYHIEQVAKRRGQTPAWIRRAATRGLLIVTVTGTLRITLPSFMRNGRRCFRVADVERFQQQIADARSALRARRTG